MQNEVTYTTLANTASVEYEIKKSIFIGYATPAKEEEAAQLFIRNIKHKHSDATHNVYGYYIKSGIIARYSDDGEPQGTAGMPVLDVIRKCGADDVCVVVTRYFGGTQLGAGGLVRAYSHTASLAIVAAGIVTYKQYGEFEFSSPYSDYDRYINEFSKMDIIVDNTIFLENVKLNVAVVESGIDMFMEKINFISQGRIKPIRIGTRFDSGRR